MAVAAEILEHLHESGVRLQVDGDRLVVEADSRLTDGHRALIRDNKPALVVELGRERRGRAALAMLVANPEIRHAWLTDDQRHPEYVILALAIRGVGTCEMSIPREKYDGFKLLEIIGAAGNSVQTAIGNHALE